MLSRQSFKPSLLTCRRALFGALLLGVVTASFAGAMPTVIFHDGFERVDTVQEIQLGIVSGPVQLRDRIVTAISANGRHLWIADAAIASSYEGVYVYRGSAAALLPAGISVGAVVDVAGSAAEVGTLTEILATEVVLVAGGGVALTPLVQSGVGDVASAVSGEPFEGVLVYVGNVTVISAGPGNRAQVQDSFGAQLTLAAGAGGQLSMLAVGSCYIGVIGVMHVDTSTGVRTLLPRSASDLTLGGGCP